MSTPHGRPKECSLPLGGVGMGHEGAHSWMGREEAPSRPMP